MIVILLENYRDTNYTTATRSILEMNSRGACVAYQRDVNMNGCVYNWK